MKRYESIGELLIDYRDVNNISQTDFADKLNVDIRTVQRWESGATLIKGDKEEEIVVETFLPYQLIRNLNSPIAIPTYYDFRVRKYSQKLFQTKLPDAFWFKEIKGTKNPNVRKIDIDLDKNYLGQFLSFQKNIPRSLTDAAMKAFRLLPEMNLISTDDSGFYSGCAIVFPIKYSTFEKLKNKEIKEEEICEKDIVNYKNEEKPYFYSYQVTADNNHDLFYLVHELFNFFRSISNLNYTLCSVALDYDSYLLAEQIGLEIIWEDEPILDKNNFEVFPRFYKGNFMEFLNKIDS